MMHQNRIVNDALFEEELQILLYRAVRDGDLVQVQSILLAKVRELQRQSVVSNKPDPFTTKSGDTPPTRHHHQLDTDEGGDVEVDNQKSMLLAKIVNGRHFHALWHHPGPSATCLHLAACCIQPAIVKWLLLNGADPHVVLLSSEENLQPLPPFVSNEGAHSIQHPQRVSQGSGGRALTPLALVDSFEIFEPARLQRPEDVELVKSYLREAAQIMSAPDRRY